MRVEVSRYIFAPPATVWDVLTDWERQAEWMVDARAVEVVGDRRTGEGVRVRVPTRIVGVTVPDELEVTGWRERERLGVRHTGRVIRGHAAFDLVATPVGTRVTWWEEIDPPLGAVGDVAGSLLVGPLVQRVFARSLANLKRLCEREARRERVGEGGRS